MRDYSNYHHTDGNERLVRDGRELFEYSLVTSPDSYRVMVNGGKQNVLMQSRPRYDERSIQFTPDTIKWGDIVSLDNEEWLVIERPYNNKIYDRTIMRLCNSSLIFEEIEREIVDFDRFGNPIYGDEEVILTEFPCVVDSVSNYKTTTGEKINIPEGDMVLLLQNTDSKLIELNKTFKMFDNNYRIAGIDKSKIHKKKGILTLIASRTIK